MAVVRGLMVASVIALTACAANVRDTRYLDSQQQPPLQIPAGLDTPNYNEQTKVPASTGPLDPDLDLARPPNLDDTD